MPKKRLLYIGNKLQKYNKSPTAIDVLSLWLQDEGYKVISKSSQKKQVFRMIDMAFSTIWFRNKVDLVIIDTYSSRNFYYAVLIGKICRMLNLAYIPILHGGNLPQRLQKSKKLSKDFFGNAKINIAPSLYLTNVFKFHGIKNLSHIPNSIKIEEYPFLERRNIGCKLLWVRSFAEIYNPLLALEVVEFLQKEGIPVELIMVGPDKDGSLARCKKIALELNLPINFTGKLKREEWITLSKDYDIFINTTNFDNTPISIMEAMALGIPVISTKVGGIAYLIEDDEEGVLVPPNDVQAFAVAIEDLLTNPDKIIRLTKSARVKIEMMDWQKTKLLWDKVLLD